MPRRLKQAKAARASRARARRARKRKGAGFPMASLMRQVRPMIRKLVAGIKLN